MPALAALLAEAVTNAQDFVSLIVETRASH